MNGFPRKAKKFNGKVRREAPHFTALSRYPNEWIMDDFVYYNTIALSDFEGSFTRSGYQLKPGSAGLKAAIYR